MNYKGNILIIKHFPKAIGLVLFGLGPKLTPCSGITQLKDLFQQNSFWATNRSSKQIKSMLWKSDVVISLWDEQKMIGFGRATTDGIYRSVLWDIVINKQEQGKGLGRLIVDRLIQCPNIGKTEKIYLMTTNEVEFYTQIGFKKVNDQNLMLYGKSKN